MLNASTNRCKIHGFTFMQTRKSGYSYLWKMGIVYVVFAGFLNPCGADTSITLTPKNPFPEVIEMETSRKRILLGKEQANGAYNRSKKNTSVKKNTMGETLGIEAVFPTITNNDPNRLEPQFRDILAQVGTEEKKSPLQPGFPASPPYPPELSQ
jgi:hypothetical protein